MKSVPAPRRRSSQADNDPAAAPPQPSQRSQAREIERQAATIAELRSVVDALRAERSGSAQLELSMAKLREANQNLVLATFGAQDSQAEAESANRRQTEFLSMLAHELRNPLQPIALANRRVGKLAGAHPELPHLNGIIERQLGHLMRLVDDLLEASRVNSGKIVLRKQVLLLSDVIDSAIETSHPFLARRGQHVAVTLADTPLLVCGDAVRLSQVFSNLLLNASKFSDDGAPIAIAARRSGDMAEVCVSDEGIGVPHDLQPFIFDLFTQGAPALQRAQGGLGIGLSLVRSIAEMHGGSASVESAGSGCGSRFTVVLPVHTGARPQRAAPAPPARRPRRRILLIDASPDALDSLAFALEQDGHSVSSAADGARGLAAACADAFDVIICAVELPVLGGNEVARQLRARLGGHIPLLIATSGYNHADGRSAAIAAGFDHYLIKPFLLDELTELICSGAAGTPSNQDLRAG